MTQLSRAEAALFEFLLHKTAGSRVPMAVCMLEMSKAIGVSYKQVRTLKKHLIDKGLIEQWTNPCFVAGNWHGSITYYRVVTAGRG